MILEPTQAFWPQWRRLGCDSTTLLLVVTALFVATGCKRGASPSRDQSGEPALQEGQYAIRGTVVSTNSERGTVLLDHEEIPGFMPAMTMEFKVAPGDLKLLEAGKRIRAVMYQGEGGFHLERIWPEDAANQRIIDEASRALRQDTVTRGAGVYREVGERLPDFALYDQTGAVVQTSRFRDKQIVLNFIFTRCPDPKMCPAATARMIGVQQQAKEAGVQNLELVSITLDPEFDTPGVLREYAESRGIDTRNFSLLTGPERAIKDLLAQLGVITLQDGPLINHTMATVLIGPDGKIIHRVDGSQWEPEDFVSRLRREVSTAESTT